MGKIIPFLQNNTIPVLLTAIFFSCAPPWPIWAFANQLSFALVVVLLYTIRKRLYHVPTTVSYITLFLLIPTFIVFPALRGWRGSSVIYILAFISLSVVYDNEFRTALKYITNILAWILVVSLPCWLIHSFVTNLIPVGFIDISAMKGGSTIMGNYIFFVVNYTADNSRFYSVFDEPGVLGTVAAFLLYANKFNLKKWQNWVILIGSIFTYSMAYFVLTPIGFLIISIKKRGQAFMSLLFLIPVLLFLYGFLKDNETFNASVMYRLFESDQSELVENRTNEIMNASFDSMMQSPDAILGYGGDKLEEIRNGASYKTFFLEYGILGFLAMLFLYRSLMKGNSSVYSFGAYTLIFISSFQRPQLWTVYDMLLFCLMIAGVSAPEKRKQPQQQALTE